MLVVLCLKNRFPECVLCISVWEWGGLGGGLSPGLSGAALGWLQGFPVSFKVSHVFTDYGPGVRYVHFLHKTKEAETPAGLLRTRATDSSVSVQLQD